MATPRARRSSLILPVNVPRCVEKAYARGADAIVLDLEDSVPTLEKASARTLVQGSLSLAGRGGDRVDTYRCRCISLSGCRNGSQASRAACATQKRPHNSCPDRRYN